MIRLANAPTSWGVEKEIETDRPPWSVFLDEVAESGYDGVELGPYGYLPTDAAVLAEELAARSLTLVAGYVMGPLHTEAGRVAALREARDVLRLVSAVGGAYLVVIPGVITGSGPRTTNGPRSMDDDGLLAVARTIRCIAEEAGSVGVRVAFHPHAGSGIETGVDADRLLAEVDRDALGLVLDTGHSFYAGDDPATRIRELGSRIVYVHLKDVTPAVLLRATEGGWEFWKAYRAGVFCPLGAGGVDFAAVRGALDSVGYSGWLTVEQDADPQGTGRPFEDAVHSRKFLQDIGLGR